MLLTEQCFCMFCMLPIIWNIRENIVTFWKILLVDLSYCECDYHNREVEFSFKNHKLFICKKAVNFLRLDHFFVILAKRIMPLCVLFLYA